MALWASKPHEEAKHGAQDPKSVARRRNLREVVTVPMEECLTLFDFDDEEDDTNVLEEALLKNPACDKDENTSPPIESDEDMGDEIHSMLHKFGGDINKILHVKRKHMETYIKDSFKSSNQKLEQVWKMNKRERKKINSKFCEQYITTFQKFDMDVQKFNEEQEKSANDYQKEQKAFKLSKSSQNQSLQAVREVHEKFMKGLMDLETKNHDMLLGIDGELRKEMSMFKRNLMKQTLKFSSAFETSD
ncbi:X-linked lymphocyte-regulated protein PM1-like [Rattus rattus]|uniref:X-linked lymphocyte-regulated protein PM1-like n=1 Tax=Rattus rattus TaxID=10117 RepID=UPI0013F35E7A|nr:X-linked lymphocyte-regulated protein PM1-like [Rattus rattus]